MPGGSGATKFPAPPITPTCEPILMRGVIMSGAYRLGQRLAAMSEAQDSPCSGSAPSSGRRHRLRTLPRLKRCVRRCHVPVPARWCGGACGPAGLGSPAGGQPSAVGRVTVLATMLMVSSWTITWRVHITR